MKVNVTININDYVYIKLNQSGKDIYRNWLSDVGLDFDVYSVKPDDQGRYKMQMWEVMQIFGEHLALGVNPPFSTLIEISTDGGVNVV